MAEDTRADYAQVSGALRGSSQESLGKGGTVSVQEHMPTGLPLPCVSLCGMYMI